MNRKIFASDLTASGSVIQLLFALVYPDGLTYDEMIHSGVGWVERAARRLWQDVGSES